MKRLLTPLKRRLPISSRSFHAYEDFANSQSRTTVEMLADMQAEIRGLRQQLTHLEETAAHHRDEVIALHQQLEDRQMFLYWQLYRHEDESIPDARRRFFSTLEPATGVNHLFQRAEIQLLHDFDVLCSHHGITYWAIFGTLLGAVRHRGMIPWDDDVDVAVTRTDLERLRSVVASDPRYQITEMWDWYVLCKQVRFRLTDNANPAFVDLFVLDATASDPAAASRAYRQARQQLTAALRGRFQHSKWPSSPYLPASHPLFHEIDAVLTDARTTLAERVNLTSNLSTATGVAYGIENIDEDHHTGPHPISRWLPPIRIPYEDFEVSALPDYHAYLTRLYGDYYRLPDDMNSHEHVAADYISSPEAVAAMERFLAETGHLTSPEDAAPSA